MARLTLGEQLTAAQQALASAQAEVSSTRVQMETLRVEREQDLTSIRLLREVAAEVPTLRTKVEQLEKDVKSKDTSYNYSNERASKAEAEIEQAHAVLDGVEGAPPRKYELDTSYGGTGQRNIVTRLAGAFLAIAKTGGVK